MSQKLSIPKAKSDVHLTPDKVFDVITNTWHYTKSQMFDPCPYHPNFDGLKIDWHGINYVNPPYSLLQEFYDKAKLEALKGCRTIMLLPAKTDKPWFHDIIANKYKIEWLDFRVQFKGNKDPSFQTHFLVCID